MQMRFGSLNAALARMMQVSFRPLGQLYFRHRMKFSFFIRYGK